MNNIDIDRARMFAIGAHAAVAQVRKYTGEPYHVHVEEVADIVKTCTGSTTEMIMAAMLHDVIEDTKVSEEMVRTMFGDTVGDLVMWLTDISKPSDGNRVVRKSIDRAHSAEAPAAAQTIKVADIISNTQSIAKHDNKFSGVFIPEVRELLSVLTKADPMLRERASKIIDDAEHMLQNDRLNSWLETHQ